MVFLPKQAEAKIKNGGDLAYEEAICLAEEADFEELLAAADEIRYLATGNKMDLCSIMNAKSGRCSENCKFCAQSGHYRTQAAEYPLVDSGRALQLAKENEARGVRRFSLVTSGKMLTEAEFERIIEIYKVLSRETQLRLCASLGCIGYERAVRLKEAGVSRYHHNVETGSDYYGRICDTHSYQERVETIENVKKARLEVCSGGILGLGEDMTQRVRMAFEIKAMGIKSVPLNILNPIPGTPLQDAPTLQPEEILRSMAIFRLIIPDAVIRYAGGRNALAAFQKRGLKAGINGMMVGDYLTTTGSKLEEDLMMIEEQGFEV
jgi:biotin synthase